MEVVRRGAGQEPPYTIRQMGIYLVVDTDAGLVLLWDRRTSIFLRLSPEFKVRPRGRQCHCPCWDTLGGAEGQSQSQRGGWGRRAGTGQTAVGGPASGRQRAQGGQLREGRVSGRQRGGPWCVSPAAPQPMAGQAAGALTGWTLGVPARSRLCSLGGPRRDLCASARGGASLSSGWALSSVVTQPLPVRLCPHCLA